MKEQEILIQKLTFLVATSVVQNLEQINKAMADLYPMHLQHDHSDKVGMKTQQFPLGLFDCNETMNQEVIQLLKILTEKYVPIDGDGVIDEVFFGGDGLIDERVQGAQRAMENAETSKGKLHFISKIEDWHRMMNFLEAICKSTFKQESSAERRTTRNECRG